MLIKIKTIDSSYFAQFEIIEENFHLISKALILKQYFSRILKLLYSMFQNERFFTKIR